jgi:hypothetical protein
MRQHSAMVSNARLALGQEKISLRAYIYEDPSSLSFNQLTNHFRIPFYLFA